MGTVEETTDPLSALGYDVAWLKYGFLDTGALLAQIARFQSGNDSHTEHYRYASFRQILTTRSEMDEDTIAHYLHLAQIDTDSGMADSALCDLLRWDGLTPLQLDTLSQNPLFIAPHFQKIVLRRRLLRALQAASVTEEIFAACLAFRDDPVQRSLVYHNAIIATQLQVVAERGVTQAVRNMAQKRMSRKNEKP